MISAKFSLPEVNSIELAQIPAAIAAAAAFQGALAARLMTATPVPESERAPTDDDLLDTEQASVHLHCSTKWLYRHAKQLSAKRRGREFLWSRRALDRWLARQGA
jgi:hypothetical protein